MKYNDLCKSLHVEIGAFAADPLQCFPSLSVGDDGRVRLGGQAPILPPEVVTGELMRLGGQAPMFLPEMIADEGLVRLGGQSPAF